MPGIVGIIGSGSSSENSTMLYQMLKCMKHESFYTSDTYFNEGLNLHVGWVSRAGSFADCMPLWNKTNDLCLIFSGEDFSNERYSEKQIIRGQQTENPQAGYLIDLFEEHGTEAFPLLNGWFSGLIIDLRNDLAMLFNDRYGMQRIYHYECNDRIYFASEAKALLAICPELRQFDFKSLGESFSFGCVLENRSLFKHVSLLPPGSLWKFNRRGCINKSSYFNPETWESQPPLETEEFYSTFRQTFIKILPKYLQPDNDVAISLTGGLDTRMILANLDISPNKLPGYSFGGMHNECYDVKISREISKITHQKHQVFEVGKNFLSEFSGLAEKTVYISDGGLDVTGSADLYVNKLARNIASVRLTGNYGSEILRGARHLKAIPPCKGLFELGFEREISLAGDTLKKAWQGHPVSLAAFKQAPWHHYNRLSLEQSQLAVRSPYLDNELVSLMFRAPRELLRNSDLSFRLINDGNPKLGNIMTDRGLRGSEQTDIYSKYIHLYREVLFKADYVFNYGMPQWLAAFDYLILAPLQVDKIFLGRHKFHHFRIWFRDELSSYVKETLLDDKSLNRSYLNKQFVRKIVGDHTSGRKNYTNEITKLLTIELLQRQMFDK